VLRPALDGLTLRERFELLFPSLQEPVTASCAFCDFRVEAPLSEAHAAFEAHECDRPPALPKRRRPPRLD
jgi:hypothetical protein